MFVDFRYPKVRQQHQQPRNTISLFHRPSGIYLLLVEYLYSRFFSPLIQFL